MVRQHTHTICCTVPHNLRISIFLLICASYNKLTAIKIDALSLLQHTHTHAHICTNKMTASYMHGTVHMYTPGGNGNRRIRIRSLFGGTAHGG